MQHIRRPACTTRRVSRGVAPQVGSLTTPMGRGGSVQDSRTPDGGAVRAVSVYVDSDLSSGRDDPFCPANDT